MLLFRSPHRQTHVCRQLRFPYLVVKLVIEEVFPQSVGKVEDSCDDDTKRARKRKQEVERVIVSPWRTINHCEQFSYYSALLKSNGAEVNLHGSAVIMKAN